MIIGLWLKGLPHELSLAMRACNLCKIEKPEEAFSPKGFRKYIRRECKECQSYQAIKRRYGLSKEDLVSLKEKQNFSCALCKQVCKLSVDHNHSTGAVRGLLCALCNNFLGKVEKDPTILERTKAYLCTHGLI
jgi:Fe-S oxidoreductase